MFRLRRITSLKKDSVLKNCTTRSVNTVATQSKFQEEWNGAKNYENIPAMSKMVAIRAFLPGGKTK